MNNKDCFALALIIILLGLFGRADLEDRSAYEEEQKAKCRYHATDSRFKEVCKKFEK